MRFTRYIQYQVTTLENASNNQNITAASAQLQLLAYGNPTSVLQKHVAPFTFDEFAQLPDPRQSARVSIALKVRTKAATIGLLVGPPGTNTTGLRIASIVFLFTAEIDVSVALNDCSIDHISYATIKRPIGAHIVIIVSHNVL
jgi:hypothetical protein